MLLANREGIRSLGPVVRLAVAGVAAAAVVYTIPVLAGQLVGVKSVRVIRVNLYNNVAGNTQVLIGTGAGALFVALFPALDSINGLQDAYGPETDLVEAESFANITAYPVALAGGSVGIDIRVEVLIMG